MAVRKRAPNCNDLKRSNTHPHGQVRRSSCWSQNQEHVNLNPPLSLPPSQTPFFPVYARLSEIIALTRAIARGIGVGGNGATIL